MARLLIVDDEPDIYELIRRYAEREGHETAKAADGMDAVLLCRENDFDLVIMDAMMPDMDGFTACKEIRRQKDIPVLMLSARGTEYDKLFGFEMGADDYEGWDISLRSKRKAFGVKLWGYFALFAAVVFLTLWLLQTVFLQHFYDGMAIRNVEKAAGEIESRQGADDLPTLLDDLAYENSFLIFPTDREGNILYSTDEHSGVYGSGRGGYEAGNGQQNNFRQSGSALGWQIGSNRHLRLPLDYDVFLERMEESEDGIVGYRLDGGAAYICGRRISTPDGEAVLYISTALEAVGGTAGILRIQLIWTTAASLLLALALAFFLSRRFFEPVAALSAKAERMAAGDLTGGFEKGFCAEMDSLAQTLDETAAALAQAENFHREFLANISHDLRTPLTMIRGYAEMVRDVSWEDAAQHETDLGVIIREADRLTALVDDILEYTALQEAPKVIDAEVVDLSAKVHEVLAQFEPFCTKEGYLVETQIEPDLLVNGDGQQLARVLYNLIDNAISHTGENRRIRVVLKPDGALVRAEVRDFGHGIAPDELPHVWERYFTAKQRQRNQKGSGLGLAISKEILTAHHAVFGAQSAEGKGSVFWFELPACTPQA